MSETNGHRVALLAQNAMGRVTVCQCEVVQVTLGPVTLRIPLSQLTAVAELMTEAVSSLSEGVELQTAPSPHLHH